MDPSVSRRDLRKMRAAAAASMRCRGDRPCAAPAGRRPDAEARRRVPVRRVRVGQPGSSPEHPLVDLIYFLLTPFLLKSSLILALALLLGWGVGEAGAQCTMQDLGSLPGGSVSRASDIDNGQVVGWALTAAGEQHAFSWTAAGGMVDLDTSGGSHSEATAVDAGQVVGFAQNAAGDSATAFLAIPAAIPCTKLFLHAQGTSLSLDANGPTDATADFRDSAALKFAGVNIWKPIGTMVRPGDRLTPVAHGPGRPARLARSEEQVRSMTARFRDRRDAGRRLAARLARYSHEPGVLVLALPRGGVPVAYEVAIALKAPLDVYLVRKLGVPGHEELAMGAIASAGVRVVNKEVVDQLGISETVLDAVASSERQELRRRERLYRGTRQPPEVAGRIVILVDDGLATGSTMWAAAEAIRSQMPRRLIVAVPVGAASVCRMLDQQRLDRRDSQLSQPLLDNNGTCHLAEAGVRAADQIQA
jgi:putative phosphoribosyl transferase